MKATLSFSWSILFCAALSAAAGDFQTQVDPRSDWSRVQRLASSTEIVLSASGVSAKTNRFVSADNTSLTVLDPDDANRAPFRIARADVSEIRRWTGRRGSILGAAIGVAGGVVLGVAAAGHLAYKQRAGSCTDERFLIGLSLTGIPIAGGLAGYYGVGDRRTLTSIYVRP